MGGSRAEKSCSREIQASVGLLDVPRAARTQPIQAEPTICPQTRPSSGNPYFSDPHAHLPLIKARRQGSTETLPSPTLLYTRKLGWTLQPLGSYSKYGCLGLSPEILSWWSGELLLILLVTVMRSQAWEPLLHSKAIPADSKSSQRAFVSPCLD